MNKMHAISNKHHDIVLKKIHCKYHKCTKLLIDNMSSLMQDNKRKSDVALRPMSVH